MNASEFLSKCRKDFGDHVFHKTVCPDKAASLALLKSLSFVSITERGLKLPGHIQAQAFIDPAGAVEVIVAGKLSVEENLEIIRATRSRGYRNHCAGGGTVELANLHAAMQSLASPSETMPLADEPRADVADSAQRTEDEPATPAPSEVPQAPVAGSARRSGGESDPAPHSDEHGAGPAVALLLLGAAGLAAYWLIHRPR